MAGWQRPAGRAFLRCITVAAPVAIAVCLSEHDLRDLAVFALALLVALGLTFLLVDLPRWRELARLTRAAARVDAGERDVRSGVSYRSESGRLARVFDE